MYAVENRIVRDSLWENIEKKLSGSGYYNPHSEVFVSKENAFEYMLEILNSDPDKAEDVMEYFYQNWIKED